MARDEKKWVLVNIQSHEEFASQMLNRDTWVDDTVVSLLRTSFVFWQRGHTCQDAQAYMRTHAVSDTDLPHIGIIDSRTGARIVTMTGFVGPDDLAMIMLEFLEENDFDNPRAPKTRNIDMRKDFDRHIASSEGRRPRSHMGSPARADGKRYVHGISSEEGHEKDEHGMKDAPHGQPAEEKYTSGTGTGTRGDGGFKDTAGGDFTAARPKSAKAEEASAKKVAEVDYGKVPEEPAGLFICTPAIYVKLLQYTYT
jgi:Thioredoxin-like